METSETLIPAVQTSTSPILAHH